MDQTPEPRRRCGHCSPRVEATYHLGDLVLVELVHGVGCPAWPPRQAQPLEQWLGPRDTERLEGIARHYRDLQDGPRGHDRVVARPPSRAARQERHRR